MTRKVTIWGIEYYDAKGVKIGAQRGFDGPDLLTPEELKELELLKKGSDTNAEVKEEVNKGS